MGSCRHVLNLGTATFTLISHGSVLTTRLWSSLKYCSPLIKIGSQEFRTWGTKRKANKKEHASIAWLWHCPLRVEIWLLVPVDSIFIARGTVNA